MVGPELEFRVLGFYQATLVFNVSLAGLVGALTLFFFCKFNEPTN